jgi:hypothetical protein
MYIHVQLSRVGMGGRLLFLCGLLSPILKSPTAEDDASPPEALRSDERQGSIPINTQYNRAQLRSPMPKVANHDISFARKDCLLSRTNVDLDL